MTGRLMGRAKLAALVAAFAVLAIACASGTTGGDSGSNDSQVGATSTPAATSTTDWQDNNGDQAEPTALPAEQDITGALFLQLDSPASEETFVTTDRIEVTGRTTVDALLSINDSVVEVNEEGVFAFAVDLEEGPNVVEVVASNAAGEQFDEVLLVMYEPA